MQSQISKSNISNTSSDMSATKGYSIYFDWLANKAFTDKSSSIKAQ